MVFGKHNRKKGILRHWNGFNSASVNGKDRRVSSPQRSWESAYSQSSAHLLLKMGSSTRRSVRLWAVVPGVTPLLENRYWHDPEQRVVSDCVELCELRHCAGQTKLRLCWRSLPYYLFLSSVSGFCVSSYYLKNFFLCDPWLVHVSLFDFQSNYFAMFSDRQSPSLQSKKSA